MPHDYTTCQDALCVRCESYGDGYTAGKGSAHLEVREWRAKQHADDCGCEPCITVFSVLKKVTITVKSL